MITAEEKVKSQKNGNIHQYVYYHCTKRKHPNCSQRFIEQKELEKQILEILGRIEIPAEFHKWAIEQLKRESYEETKERNKILENQKLNYQKCLRRIDKLMEMRMNEEIDQQEFLEKKSELLKEKSQLQELLNDTNERVNGWIEKTENMFNFAEKAKARFETGTAEDKRQILSALGSNLLLKDRILSISIEKPLILIEQAASEVRNIHSRLEPVKTGKNRINFDELYLENPILLPL
jgi:hypothetical protein